MQPFQLSKAKFKLSIFLNKIITKRNKKSQKKKKYYFKFHVQSGTPPKSQNPSHFRPTCHPTVIYTSNAHFKQPIPSLFWAPQSNQSSKSNASDTFIRNSIHLGPIKTRNLIEYTKTHVWAHYTQKSTTTKEKSAFKTQWHKRK